MRSLNWKRVSAVLLLVVLVTGAAVFFVVLPPRVERGLNATRVVPPYRVSEEVAALHDSLLVADLHADSLLWSRDLSSEGGWGHVDIPRLRAANVAIQAFTVVTKVPVGQNIASNSADAADRITPLAVAQRWPVRTWFSLRERALYQAERLHALASHDEGLVLLRNTADLNALVIRRGDDSSLVGALLGIEGLHCLEGKLENIDVLFDAGFRMMAPTHFFDTELGGSAHGESGGGLTEFGRRAIQKMDERNIIIDLAHASPAMIDDILALTTRPVLVSHTGVRGTCDNERNLSDAHLRGIAEKGGLIGIALFKTAVCGDDAAASVSAMKYVADLVGVEHVALGSDFDGAITVPFDVTGLPLVTEALIAAGFSDTDIGKIMGENVRDFLSRTLPVE